MTNATFYRLYTEFTFMYEHSKEFHDYCENEGIMFTDKIYGIKKASADDMKTVRSIWRNQKNPWFSCWEEWEEWVKNNGREPYMLVGAMTEEEYEQWCE